MNPRLREYLTALAALTAFFVFAVFIGWFVDRATAVEPGQVAGTGTCHGKQEQKREWTYRVKGGPLVTDVERCVNHTPESPPEPMVVEAAADPTYTRSVAPPASGSCPSYMVGEANSPTAVNPTSAAGGCFQVLPSTAVAHGCAPDQSTVSTTEQAACAARICETQGDAAWVAADPCGPLAATEP